MTVETLSRSEYARELGFVDDEGSPRNQAIAQLFRDAISRWGLSPRGALLNHARDQLRAGDVDVDSVPDVLEKLVDLGECAEVMIGNEFFIAPAEPRWVAVGGDRAALLGPLAVPEGVAQVKELPSSDVVVRINVDGEDAPATLGAGGWRQISIEEWLQPIGYLRHLARREMGAVRADQWTLAKFWERLVSEVSEEGLLLGPDAELRVVAGPPGGFFGRHTAPGLEGRWVERPSEGLWCAYRRGYGENHWIPTIVSVDGDQIRSLDLFDGDEWRWALLARSQAYGVEEVVQRDGGLERVTWPLPAQLRAAMDLIGVPAGPWRWRVAEDAPDVWSLLRYADPISVEKHH